MEIEIKKSLVKNWFKVLQDVICNEIEDIEHNSIKFISKGWERNKKKDEGGGEYRILENGKIFDKAGVNFSEVYGKFSKEFRKKIPGAIKNPNFWATGISVVMHMKIHMCQQCILILDIFKHLTDGLGVEWTQHHALKILNTRNGFIMN